MNFVVNNSNIVVTKEIDGQIVKLGSVQDSCCNTNVILKGVTQPLIFDNERGKGGFLAKKLYIPELIDAFQKVYHNEKLKQELMKFPITISKAELENGSYINKLK
jgi:hypothetical protein